MPIDTSMYQNMKSLDPATAVEEGLRMRDLVEQRNLRQKEAADKEALKGTYKAGVVQNPDGTTTFDGGKTMSAMMEKGFVQEAQKFNQEQTALNLAKQDAAMKKQLQEIDHISRVTATVKDQASYDQALVQASGLGLDVSKMPKAYDPNLIKTYQGMALSAKDRLEQQMKEREFGLKERELNIKKGELGQKAGFTAGQKKVDQEFATDYNEWTSGGAESARAEIAKLQSVAENLKNKKVTTGGLTGAFSDRFTSTDVLSARADVQSTIMKSLKALMGNAFTEKEGQRVIANTWNEADSTDNNLIRLNRLSEDLISQANSKDAKGEHFQRFGTLSGYKPSSMAQKQASSGNLNDLSDEAIDAMYKKAGGK